MVLKKSGMAIVIILLFVFEAKANEYDLFNIIVLDGDTLRATISLGYDTYIKKDVRCLYYDAWEISKHRRTVEVTDEEIIKGKVAQVELEKLIKSADRVYIEPGKPLFDSYGRVLGKLMIKKNNELINVSVFMKENHHVRE